MIEKSIITRSNVFTQHDAHPIVIAKVLLDEFGREWLDWDPLVLWTSVDKIFGYMPSTLAKDKINAVKATLVNDGFYTAWEVFNPTMLALTNNIPEFACHRPLTIPQLYCGWDIAYTIRNGKCNNEIARYVAASFLQEAVYYCPPPFEFVQELVSIPMYKCLSCGNIDTDNGLGVCDVCSQRFTGEDLTFMPSKERLAYMKKTGEGTKLERFEKHPYVDVKKRYEEVSVNSELLGDNAVDLQVGLLLSAKQYIHRMQKRAEKQLKGLALWK